MYLSFLGENVSSKFHIEEFSQEIFQVHFERIADYFLPGEGIWWHKNNDYIIFHDGDHEPNFRAEGPELHHFNNVDMQSNANYVEKCWELCLKQHVILPLKIIKVFDAQGDFQENLVMMERNEVETQEDEIEIVEVKNIDNDVNMETEGTTSNVLPSASNVSTRKTYLYNLKSGIAKMICTITGISDQLREFDKQHVLYKDFKYESSRKRCQNILPKLQENVTKEYMNAKIFVDDWQKSYFVTHGIEPGKDQLEENEQYHQNFTKLVNGKKLLKMWNLNF